MRLAAKRDEFTKQHSTAVDHDRQSRHANAEILVRRCAQGDEEALAELHDHYAKSLLWLARGVVRSREAAEEVVQEVLIYVWRRAETYDRRRGTVYTWMSQVARSRAIDHLRRRGTQQRTRAQAASESAASIESGVEKKVYLGELRPRLEKALQTLPTAQRQAVVQAYYGEMTQREIADRNQIPLGTVKTRTALAMRKLRAELSVDALQAW